MIPGNSKFSQTVFSYCLFISLLGVLIFANHLNNPFQFDSVPYITNNANLQNPGSLLTADFLINEFAARGLLRMTMALNAYLDGLRPFGYHILSLVFHILNSLLLFFVLEKSFRRFGLTTKGWDKKRIQNISFFAAVLFLCHPIQTESVIYIMSRSEVLATTFYLSGFLLFQQLLERSSTSPIQYFFYSLVICSVALLGYSVKQIVATLPATMLFYYFSSCSEHSPAWQFMKKWKWWVVGFFSILGILLFYKLFTDESFLVGPSRTYEMVGRVKYMLSQPGVIIFYYLKKLLFPINLNVDPDVEIVASLLSWSFIIPFLCIVVLLVGSLLIFKNRFIFFFLCWFFIILSPSSSIVTLHDLAAEHRAYLASSGIFILLAYGVSVVTRKCMAKPSRKVAIIFYLFVGILSVLTIERNTTWQSELSLWKDAYQKSPHKIRPLINLARAHSLQDDKDKAIKYYEEALAQGPWVFASNYNLGDLYLEKGLLDDALQLFLKASRIEPEIPETFAKLGDIYLMQKQYKLADSYFKHAVELNPRLATVFKNLGIVNFYHLNNRKQGLAYFSRSLNLDPTQSEADKIRKIIHEFSIQ